MAQIRQVTGRASISTWGIAQQAYGAGAAAAAAAGGSGFASGLLGAGGAAAAAGGGGMSSYPAGGGGVAAGVSMSPYGTPTRRCSIGTLSPYESAPAGSYGAATAFYLRTAGGAAYAAASGGGAAAPMPIYASAGTPSSRMLGRSSSGLPLPSPSQRRYGVSSPRTPQSILVPPRKPAPAASPSTVALLAPPPPSGSSAGPPSPLQSSFPGSVFASANAGPNSGMSVGSYGAFSSGNVAGGTGAGGTGTGGVTSPHTPIGARTSGTGFSHHASPGGGAADGQTVALLGTAASASATEAAAAALGRGTGSPTTKATNGKAAGGGGGSTTDVAARSHSFIKVGQ